MPNYNVIKTGLSISEKKNGDTTIKVDQIKIPGDGNCFFHSLIVANPEATGTDVAAFKRKLLPGVKQLISNSANAMGITFQERCRINPFFIRKPGKAPYPLVPTAEEFDQQYDNLIYAYTDDTFVQAAANYLQRPIEIHSFSNGKSCTLITPTSHNNQTPIRVLRSGYGATLHYDLLVPTGKWPDMRNKPRVAKYVSRGQLEELLADIARVEAFPECCKTAETDAYLESLQAKRDRLLKEQKQTAELAERGSATFVEETKTPNFSDQPALLKADQRTIRTQDKNQLQEHVGLILTTLLKPAVYRTLTDESNAPIDTNGETPSAKVGHLLETCADFSERLNNLEAKQSHPHAIDDGFAISLWLLHRALGDILDITKPAQPDLKQEFQALLGPVVPVAPVVPKRYPTLHDVLTRLLNLVTALLSALSLSACYDRPEPEPQSQPSSPPPKQSLLQAYSTVRQFGDKFLQPEVLSGGQPLNTDDTSVSVRLR